MHREPRGLTAAATPSLRVLEKGAMGNNTERDVLSVAFVPFTGDEAE
ncbi:MAG: hypothetical protein LOD94_16525 [Gammaproteobacteria bacterium]